MSEQQELLSRIARLTSLINHHNNKQSQKFNVVNNNAPAVPNINSNRQRQQPHVVAPPPHRPSIANIKKNSNSAPRLTIAAVPSKPIISPPTTSKQFKPASTTTTPLPKKFTNTQYIVSSPPPPSSSPSITSQTIKTNTTNSNSIQPIKSLIQSTNNPTTKPTSSINITIPKLSIQKPTYPNNIAIKQIIARKQQIWKAQHQQLMYRNSSPFSTSGYHNPYSRYNTPPTTMMMMMRRNNSFIYKTPVTLMASTRSMGTRVGVGGLGKKIATVKKIPKLLTSNNTIKTTTTDNNKKNISINNTDYIIIGNKLIRRSSPTTTTATQKLVIKPSTTTSIPPTTSIILRNNTNIGIRKLQQTKRLNISDRIRNTLKKKRKNKTQPCLFFNRFGKCNNGDKCKYEHDPKRVRICFKYISGKCDDENCTLQHKEVSELDPEQMPVCYQFLRGMCMNDNCPYLHVHVSKDAQVCPDFLKGHCPKGSSCQMKHTYSYAKPNTEKEDHSSTSGNKGGHQDKEDDNDDGDDDEEEDEFDIEYNI